MSAQPIPHPKPAPNIDKPLPSPRVRSEKSPCGKFLILYPETDLRTKAPILRDQNTDPIAAAEHHIEIMSVIFDDWARDARETLQRAWNAWATDSDDALTGEGLRAAVHDVKGNAATFGYELSGQIAASIAILMERTKDWREDRAILSLGIAAIIACLSEQGKHASPLNIDVHNAIGVVIDRKLHQRRHIPAGA